MQHRQRIEAINKRSTTLASLVIRFRDVISCLLPLVVSAYLTMIAVGLPDFPWLAWVSLAPLFVAICRQRPSGAALSGAVWGGCLYLFLTVAVTPSSITGSFTALALLIVVPSIYTWAGALYTRRFGFNPLALALGWIAVELALRPIGLAHGLLAANQNTSALLQGLSNVLGYGFVAFLVSLVNALLLSVAVMVAGASASRRLFTRTSTSFFIRWRAISPLVSENYLRHLRPRAPPSVSEA